MYCHEVRTFSYRLLKFTCVNDLILYLLRLPSFFMIPDIFFNNIDALEERKVLCDQVGEVDQAWTIRWFSAQQNDLKKHHHKSIQNFFLFFIHYFIYFSINELFFLLCLFFGRFIFQSLDFYLWPECFNVVFNFSECLN